jgi:hypothetical protein
VEPLVALRIPLRRPPGEAADRVLRNAKLERLHHWLQLNIGRYVGLYETGSLPAGDPWVEGRSDRDVLIVIDGEISDQDREAIAAQLALFGFNDTYLFNLARRGGFLQTHSDHDIAMKFRGLTLFGPDLVARKETPSRAFAEQWAEAGLLTLPGRLRIRVLNARCWSLERLRDEIYFLLKQMLLFLADRSYADTGRYPKRRLDVADAYGSNELRELASAMVAIDQASRETLTWLARSAIGVLQRLNHAATVDPAER